LEKLRQVLDCASIGLLAYLGHGTKDVVRNRSVRFDGDCIEDPLEDVEQSGLLRWLIFRCLEVGGEDYADIGDDDHATTSIARTTGSGRVIAELSQPTSCLT
jgi:hypothetical protein